MKIIICTERTMFSRCSKASILMPSLSLFKNGLFYSFRSCNLNREVVGLCKNPRLQYLAAGKSCIGSTENFILQSWSIRSGS